jgi:hypothetical protein
MAMRSPLTASPASNSGGIYFDLPFILQLLAQLYYHGQFQLQAAGNLETVQSLS